MFKKYCPECEKYIYSANKEIEKCVNCGANISQKEAIPAGHNEQK